MIQPKKYYGQHFLTDNGIAKKICNCLENDLQLPVVEIGPGKGILTQHLLQRVGEVYAVEIDTEACNLLRKNYSHDALHLIEGDYLHEDIGLRGSYCLAGNLPYNISSPIFFDILNKRSQVQEAVFMIQKEVAQRIASVHGNKTYGILSVLLQAFYEVKLCMHVKPGSFYPPPKVHSSVIHMKKKDREPDCDINLFFRVVKTAFNQRRKTLRNALKSILLNLPEDSGVWQKRAEQLDVNAFIELTKIIEGKNGRHAV